MPKPPSWAFVKPIQVPVPIQYLAAVDRGALFPALRPGLDEKERGSGFSAALYGLKSGQSNRKRNFGLVLQ
jgi:hypothetical protein